MREKYRLYRLLYPLRVRRQTALRDARSGISADDFGSKMGSGRLRTIISAYLWDRLRELAFVPDFRPSGSDNLGEIFALSPASIRDEVVEGLIDRLGLKTEHLDFTGFNFSSLQTPSDIADFVERVAALQDRPAGTRFV